MKRLTILLLFLYSFKILSMEEEPWPREPRLGDCSGPLCHYTPMINQALREANVPFDRWQNYYDDLNEILRECKKSMVPGGLGKLPSSSCSLPRHKVLTDAHRAILKNVFAINCSSSSQYLSGENKCESKFVILRSSEPMNWPEVCCPLTTRTFDPLLDADRGNQEMTDCSFEVGGQWFPAHTAVVCLRSKAINKKLGESKTGNKVCIDDADSQSFLAVLDFLYSKPRHHGASSWVGIGRLCNLIKVAKTYCLDDLSDICRREVVKALGSKDLKPSSEALIALLNFDHSDKEIIQSCATYAKEHRAEFIELSVEQLIQIAHCALGVAPTSLSSLSRNHAVRLKDLMEEALNFKLKRNPELWKEIYCITNPVPKGEGNPALKLDRLHEECKSLAKICGFNHSQSLATYLHALMVKVETHKATYIDFRDSILELKNLGQWPLVRRVVEKLIDRLRERNSILDASIPALNELFKALQETPFAKENTNADFRMVIDDLEVRLNMENERRYKSVDA